jgi:hypothetical protein
MHLQIMEEKKNSQGKNENNCIRCHERTQDQVMVAGD